MTICIALAVCLVTIAVTTGYPSTWKFDDAVVDAENTIREIGDLIRTELEDNETELNAKEHLKQKETNENEQMGEDDESNESKNAKMERKKKENWNKVEKMLEGENKEHWQMKGDNLQIHYPKELKEKLAKGINLTQNEIDEFEDGYGRYKSRPEITVVDLIDSINKAHDADVNSVDIVRNKIPDHVKRSSVVQQVYLWKSRIVPYEIHSDLANYNYTLENAMHEIANVSCIKFVARTTENNWIKFVRRDGCYSDIGQIFWTDGPQEISIGKGCTLKGIIQHEVLHALGFHHEQTRYDRDNYVEIFWENIMPESRDNFDKMNANEYGLLGTAYDYKSIMQYGKYSFAIDPSKPTIMSIQEPSASFGQRDSLSQLDIYELNELYTCSVNGTGWSGWSRYGPCSSDCYKDRSRFCMNAEDKTSCPNPTNTKFQRWGIDQQRVKCTHAECKAPVDGHWNKWSSWGKCSTKCDAGTKKRKRKCTDPKPKHGGAYCVGSNIDVSKCLLRYCNAGPNDCTFDLDTYRMCGWKLDATGDFQWTRNSEVTPSSSTGPSEDHTSGTGFYMFIETSSPVEAGDKARLLSRPIKTRGKRCFQFAYHMYGSTMGSLRVSTKDKVTGVNEVFFNKSGDQLNKWHEAKFDVSARNAFQIVIEGVRGSSFRGDIAIDDIQVTKGPCIAPTKRPTKTKTTTTTTTTTTSKTTTTATPSTTSTTTMASTTTTPKPKIPAVESVGCYKDVGYIDGVRPFRSYKDLSKLVKWTADVTLAKINFKDIVGNCSAFARANNHKYFAIQYWRECWVDAINYGRDGESTGCWPKIEQNAGPFIIGTDYTNMVYRWDD